jgi:Arc/MetJ-type ribon-helix-helix transcriptional regulator
MRQIISFSLPAPEVQFINKQVKLRNFKSKSDYLRHLLTLEQDMITETDLLRYTKEARTEHQSGKTKRLNSLKDLLN